ncbi:hypothetical protein HD806DRAFT_489670 [Xylariaceae sp. AK1471]|nr:hypothetical protein HD806DRAFT_489670 [Xylariaceae sp. AK1471]
MDSFAKLKRRGTDLLNSLPHNMPSMPSMPRIGGYGMKGTWQHVSLPSLPRDSHSLDIIAGNAYIFGGGSAVGKPIDNDMHVVVLPWSGAPADYYSIKAIPSSRTSAKAEPIRPAPITEDDETAAQLKDPLDEVPLTSPSPSGIESDSEPSTADKGKGKAPAYSDVPSPRIGHATAVIGTRIFLFGGRSTAVESSPVNEKGRVWVFETKTHTWTYLDPHHSSPIPPARSDHAAIATEKPRDFAVKPMRLRRSSTWKEWAEGDSAEVGIPQRPIAGTIAENATDDEAEGAGFGTFIIHAGLLADGIRTNDVWAFDVHARTWKQLPDAPGPARTGTTLALAKSRLYRFGGSDGETEIGGQLDALRLGLDEFDDQNTKGEIGIFARGTWESIYPPATSPNTTLPAAETAGLTASPTSSDPWPAPRRGASLSLVQAGGGREYLVLLHGESFPLDKTYSDVWAFQVPPLGGTAASVTDAFLQTMGRKTGEGRWTPVSLGPFDADDELDVQGPEPRAWFAAAPLGDLEENAIFVTGGHGDSSGTLGDGWFFRLG